MLSCLQHSNNICTQEMELAKQFPGIYCGASKMARLSQSFTHQGPFKRSLLSSRYILITCLGNWKVVMMISCFTFVSLPRHDWPSSIELFQCLSILITRYAVHACPELQNSVFSDCPRSDDVRIMTSATSWNCMESTLSVRFRFGDLIISGQQSELYYSFTPRFITVKGLTGLDNKQIYSCFDSRVCF